MIPVPAAVLDLISKAPQRAAVTFCAFETLTCAAQSRACVISRPQVIFRAQRIVIAPSCAPFFDLCDFQIGNVSQRSNNDPVSAEFFPPLPGDARPREAFPFGPDGTSAEFFPPFPVNKAEREALKRFTQGLGTDTCPIGTDMILSIKNKDDKPQRFEAIVWGVFLENL